MDKNLEEARKIALKTYKETNDLKLTSLKSGLNSLSLFRFLTVSGALSMRDRLTMGTASTQLGAKAELEFRRICPIAMLVNCDEKQHKSYDFILKNGQTIDVKAASLINTKPSRSRAAAEMWKWAIQRHYQESKGSDYYVLFAIHGDDLKCGYDVFILPTNVTYDVKKIEVRKSTIQSHWLWEFRIEADEVLDFFAEMCDTPNIEQSDAYKEIFLSDEKNHFDVEVASIKNTSRKITRLKNERSNNMRTAQQNV